MDVLNPSRSGPAKISRAMGRLSLCKAAGRTLGVGVLSLTVAAFGGGIQASATTNSRAVTSGIVKAAKAAVAAHSGVITTWTGPTSGPKLSPGKTIAYVSCGSFNSICVEIGHDLTTIGKSIGWHVKIFNGQGTTSGWLSAFDDAVALHPAGIILGAITPSSVPAPMAKARSLGIPVVGALAASYPGPNQMGLFYNASEAPAAIGKLEADWAIAESNGTARVILMYDDTYAIARAKNAEYVATLRECKTCTILKDVETPFADLGTNGSSLVDSWLSKWGTKPIYLISVGDVAFPDLIPTLEARHVPKNMFLGIGADGEPSAYQYIRGGNYQVATVPQPDQELSYECLDELNRAFHHQPAAVFNPPPYLVTKADINIQGGAKNEYDPANGYAAHYMKIWGIR